MCRDFEHRDWGHIEQDDRNMNFVAVQENAKSGSRILKAMANERRLIILCYLSEGERSVGELEELIGISQSALSQHLARLRKDGLVVPRRSSQNVFYSLYGDEARLIIGLLQELVSQDDDVRISG